MIEVIAVVGLITATAVFVGGEFAFVAVDRHRIDVEAAAGNRRAQATANVLTRLSYHLSAIQLGITLTSILLGYVAEPAISPWLEPLTEQLPFVTPESNKGVAVTAAFILATVVTMVIGELVPKNFAIATPHKTAITLGWVIRLYGIAFGPLIKILNGAANWTVRRFGIEPKEELASVRTLDELELVVRSAGDEGVLEAESLELLNRTFRFTNRNVADVLVPRHDVEALPVSASVNDLIALAAPTGHSRFPIYDSDLDHIVGVVHIKDVFRIEPTRRDSALVRELIHEIPALPETVTLQSALESFRQGSHLALVVDEHGGTSGVLTLDDLLSDLVGDIRDEYDWTDVAQVLPVRGAPVEIPGSTHVDELEDIAGLELPKGAYDTVAGYVMFALGTIPDVGDKVTYDDWRITVTGREGLRISSLHVAPMKGANQ